jgi:hypothetical protein
MNPARRFQSDRKARRHAMITPIATTADGGIWQPDQAPANSNIKGWDKVR